MKKVKSLILIVFICLAKNTYAQSSFEILFGDSTLGCSAHSVVQLSSGTLVVLTSCYDSAGTGQEIIFRFTPSGNFISSVTIGNPLIHLTRMKKTPDGNLMMCGSVIDSAGKTDGLLIKTDTSGNQLWQKNFGRTHLNESFSGLDFTSSGNIVSSGYTLNQAGSGNSFYAIYADSAGTLIWDKPFNSSGNSVSDAIICLSDGSLIISGDRFLPSGAYTNALIHADSSGGVIWDLPLPNSYNNGCKNDILTSHGHVLVVGESATQFNPIFDPAISKIDTAGNVIWSYIYNGSAVTTDALFDVVEPVQDTYVAVGYGGNPFTGSVDIPVLTIDSAGNEIFRVYVGDSTGMDMGLSVISSLNAQGIYISGSSVSNGTSRGYLVYRTMSSLQETKEITEEQLIIYPNPSSGVFYFQGLNNNNVTAAIYDVQGRKIFQQYVQGNKLDAGNIPSGIYILNLISPTFSKSVLISIQH